MNPKVKHPILRRIGKICLIVAAVLAFLYGILLLWLNAMLSSGLKNAKANWTPATVVITELESVQHNPFWCAVTLEKPHENAGKPPISEHDKTPPPDDKLGRTCASTLKHGLHIGSEVTMYCNPQDTDKRVVDFGNTSFLLPTGLTMLGISLLIWLVLICRHVLRSRRRRPAVHTA